MEMEEKNFIIGSLILQYQRIQYDNANKWKTKACKAEQSQHHMTIEKVKLIWLSFLEL